jgi:tetratricopeptide (TPR) repeat protein
VALIERYSAPVVDKLFNESEKEIPSLLIDKLAEARTMLIDPGKRKEYYAYLQSGKTGSFAKESKSVKRDEIFAQAQKLTAEGKGAQALALFEKAVSEFPDVVDLVVGFARIALQQGGAKNSVLRDKVLNELKRALKITPPSGAVLESFGEWCEALGQKAKAQEAFAKALEVSPFSPSARASLERLDPQVAARAAVSAIYKKLAKLNYYQLLGIDLKANRSVVQKAYHECTKRFHPDRFFQSDNAQLREESKEVYKRMVEAYMTLKNPTKRKEYDDRLSSSR